MTTYWVLALHFIATAQPMPSFVWPATAFAIGIVFGMILGAAIQSRVKRLEVGVGAGIVAAILGIVGLAVHGFWIAPLSGSSYIPVFDNTTMLWGLFLVVGVAFPLVSEVTVGGVNVKIRKAEKVGESATDLMQTWIFTTRDLLYRFETEKLTPEEAGDAIKQFLQLRAYEALKWIGQDEEKRRLSVWIYNPRLKKIEFFFSNQIRDKETTQYKFDVGKGIIGTVFKNDETWNEVDASDLPIWVSIRDEEPEYHGIFLRPINYGDYRIGVLSVDREKAERFEKDSQNVLIGFASMIATVLGNEKARNILAGLNK